MGGPYQRVVVNAHVGVRAVAVGLENRLHGAAVFLPQLSRSARERLVGLQRPEKPQRRVDRVVRVAHVREQAPLHLRDHRVEHLAARAVVALGQRDAGQRDERVAAPAPEPRVAGHDLGPVAVADDELAGRVAQAR